MDSSTDLYQVLAFLPDNARRCKLSPFARTITELRQAGASFGLIVDHLKQQAGLEVSRQAVAKYYKRIEATRGRVTPPLPPVRSLSDLPQTFDSHPSQSLSTLLGGLTQVIVELRRGRASFGMIADHLNQHFGISITPENLAWHFSRLDVPAPQSEGQPPALTASVTPQTEVVSTTHTGNRVGHAFADGTETEAPSTASDTVLAFTGEAALGQRCESDRPAGTGSWFSRLSPKPHVSQSETPPSAAPASGAGRDQQDSAQRWGKKYDLQSAEHQEALARFREKRDRYQ
ncbi:hypothetical protein [Ralstonia soli]|uniref:Uncharacterized protein n=1 Tax=Ralstonia soli TaxID=2953896 RepID=A0ABT1AE32_9RALS|nr:hypothetical protein [Ralstonia soli]MCO5396658.1 hypothetical protein [Ralstonia soli]